MKIIHSKGLEQFKKNPMERIEKVAKSKTEWLKDFVESQKKEKPEKTVGDMFKEMNRENHLYHSKK